jgi:hypothetical protein
MRHLDLLLAQAITGNATGKNPAVAERFLKRERHALSTRQPEKKAKGGADVIGKPIIASFSSKKMDHANPRVPQSRVDSINGPQASSFHNCLMKLSAHFIRDHWR